MYTVHRLPFVRKHGQTVLTNSIKKFLFLLFDYCFLTFVGFCFWFLFVSLFACLLRILMHSPPILFPYFKNTKFEGKCKFYHLPKNECLPKWRASTFTLTEQCTASVMFTLLEYLRNICPFSRLTLSLVFLGSHLLILNHFYHFIPTWLSKEVFNSPLTWMFYCAYSIQSLHHFFPDQIFSLSIRQPSSFFNAFSSSLLLNP